jgi:hypothetical protein
MDPTKISYLTGEQKQQLATSNQPEPSHKSFSYDHTDKTDTSQGAVIAVV